MGAKSSTSSEGRSWRQSYSSRSTSSSSWNYDFFQSSVSQYAESYPVQQTYSAEYPPPDQYYAPPIYGAPSHSHAPQKKLDRRYSRIADKYNSLEEVGIYSMESTISCDLI